MYELHPSLLSNGKSESAFLAMSVVQQLCPLKRFRCIPIPCNACQSHIESFVFTGIPLHEPSPNVEKRDSVRGSCTTLYLHLLVLLKSHLIAPSRVFLFSLLSKPLRQQADRARLSRLSRLSRPSRHLNDRNKTRNNTEWTPLR